MTQAEKSSARAGKHKALRLILGAGLCLVALIGLGSLLLERFGVGVHGDPLRLIGLAQASVEPGCYPERVPMACHIAGRAWRLQSSGAAWGLTADNAHPGNYRFELRQGDMWAKDVRLKKGKGARGQVERVEFSDLKRQPFGKDFWFAFTLMVEPGPKTTSDWVNLGQLHNTPDPGEASASPPWVQGFGPNDSFRIWVRHTTQNPLVANPQPVVLFEDHTFQRGRPYRFVYRFRWDPRGAGLAQVWRDGQLVGNYRGPFGYPDQRGGYFKFGIYRRPAPETMVVHYSDVRTGPNPLMSAEEVRKADAAPEMRVTATVRATDREE